MFDVLSKFCRRSKFYETINLVKIRQDKQSHYFSQKMVIENFEAD